MRRILTVLATVGALSLAACEPVSVADVQAIARQACGFLPTAETVTSIFLKADPRYQTAQQIADAICGAVGPATLSARRGARAAPTVAGVPVRGTRVR